MERIKESLERKPEYQNIVNPGYDTGFTIYYLSRNLQEMEQAAREKANLKPDMSRKELDELSLKKGLKGHFVIEPQMAKSKQQERTYKFDIGHNRDRDTSFSGDGNGYGELDDTIEIQGPLSREMVNHLRTITREMKDTDVAIQRAVENGNSEDAERMTDQWARQRADLLSYLKKSNVRVNPMKLKRKEKIMKAVEKVEERQKKPGRIHHIKTKGLSRERTLDENPE